MTTYTGDVVNTRLILEHILDDKKGFGYNIDSAGYMVSPGVLMGML